MFANFLEKDESSDEEYEHIESNNKSSKKGG